MKRIIMIYFAILGIIVAVSFEYLLYQMRYKVTLVDTAQSADGVYEVILLAVGEPAWLYSPAPGRLVLKNDAQVISRTNFKISNDGGPFNERSWSVAWYDDYAEIILSGDQQPDEQVLLYYDGQVERTRLYGIETGDTYIDTEEDVDGTTEDLEYELFPGEWQIREGYESIYELYSDGSVDHFDVYYGAKAFSSRCVLSEDDNTVEYLIYNGNSENGKCGLYVHYQSQKDTDGTWSEMDAAMIDIYAYVYESGAVVSSGKTHWGDIGSEAYREVTGGN